MMIKKAGRDGVSETLTILIIDDDAASRSELARVLMRAGLEVEEAAHGEDGVKAAAERPAAVILEVALPDIDGLELCRELRDRHGNDLPVIIVSRDRLSRHERVAALLIGADDYLAKPIDPDELLARLRRLLARARVPTVVRRGEPSNGLTDREVEVLQLLASGLSPGAIAERLVISRKTVASHLQKIMSKLQVHSQAQAVAEAYRLGVVRVDFEPTTLPPRQSRTGDGAQSRSGDGARRPIHP
jgi:DNA-binding NarL/FixJ family response regulator